MAGRLTSDHVHNYSLAVCWYGLLHLCHLDTIREAVCLGISGRREASLIDDVSHNCTVNLKGGADHNIAMDRVCEFLNTEKLISWQYCFTYSILVKVLLHCLCSVTTSVMTVSDVTRTKLLSFLLKIRASWAQELSVH